ncbi:MAG: DMT family transporter [Haloferacaceae archaeon]
MDRVGDVMDGRRTALLYLVLAALWGSSFVGVKVALDAFSPVFLAAVRFSISAVVLFAATALTGRRVRPRGAGDWAPIVTGGVFIIGVHNALLFAGQQYVPSAVASTLLGLIPILTPAVNRFVRPDQRLSRQAVLGLGAGFLGVVLIADPDPANLLADVRGIGFVFASAVTFVLGAVLTRETEASLSSLALQSWMALLGSSVLLVAVPFLPGESFAAAWSPAVTGWVLYLSLVPGALGFFLYFHLLDRLGPVQMGLLEYVIPPFAALFGWLVRAEPLSPSTVYGFFAILVGFLLLKGGSLRAALRARRSRN